MNYLSVCSGIEAATVAWHHLGWKAIGYSEIEKFPSEVLAHHYPDVPNLGDMTKYKEWDFGANRLDLLVGGTPCQSFSVAGLRKGLEDPRGNLALTYVGILDKFRPKWCIWENVPGVLSSNGGRDFGSFLGALVELGYGFAYRVLDAKNFGVAQRRRRVFVVGCSSGWKLAAKVLFESESLSGNNSESSGKRKRTTTTIEGSIIYGGSDPNCSDTVTSKWAKGSGGPSGNECGLFVAHTFKVRGGCEGGGKGYLGQDEAAFTISCNQDQQLFHNMAVRRLTPVECERLQGFPDNYTNIKENCPDSPRYKAIGNSMAVPVMKWIGQRIQKVENEK